MYTQTHTFIEECRHDTALQESHIPGLIAVKAALRLKAAQKERPFYRNTHTHTHTHQGTLYTVMRW